MKNLKNLLTVFGLTLIITISIIGSVNMFVELNDGRVDRMVQSMVNPQHVTHNLTVALNK